MEVKGIVHITEAVGINVARGVGTNLANFFGDEGFQSKLYDTVKANAFEKLKIKYQVNILLVILKWILKPQMPQYFVTLLGQSININYLYKYLYNYFFIKKLNIYFGIKIVY